MYESKMYAAFLHASSVMFSKSRKSNIMKSTRQRNSELFLKPINTYHKDYAMHIIKIRHRENCSAIKLLPLKIRPKLSPIEIVRTENNIKECIHKAHIRNYSTEIKSCSVDNPLQLTTMAYKSDPTRAYNNHKIPSKYQRYLKLKIA